jgi:signal transduction histidine kinase
MWMSDNEGRSASCNRRWTEYLDGDTDRIMGSGWAVSGAPGRPRRGRPPAHAAVGGRARVHDRVPPASPRRAVPLALTRVVPHKDDGGRVLNWFGTAADIHDLKTAEEDVLPRQGRGGTRQQGQGQFLAVLSHELRTPLTPVVMTVAAMEMDRTLSPQQREDLAMIRRNIELETKADRRPARRDADRQRQAPSPAAIRPTCHALIAT